MDNGSDFDFASDRIHRGEDINMVAFFREHGEQWMVRERIFDSCTLIGPAVLIVMGGTQFRGNRIDRRSLWVIELHRPYMGALGVEYCLFENCTFESVGIAGNADFVARLDSDLRGDEE
jgi:hypothetical protein